LGLPGFDSNEQVASHARPGRGQTICHKIKDNSTVELSDYTIESLIAELEGSELELA
jgi:hypothetical protein